jgi:AraC-like DNA-binding protein
MARDPFSDILRLTRAQGVMSVGLRARGKFAVCVDRHEGMKFNAITEGCCWLEVEDREPVDLEEGDCFLLTKGKRFTVGNDHQVDTRPAEEVFAGTAGAFATLDCGDGERVTFIGGKMTSDRNMSLLTSALPDLLVLRRGTPPAERVEWLLRSLHDELQDEAPGADAMAEQIMHMIFIEMIRALPEEDRAPGWLAASCDPRIGKAIRLLHADPGRKWRLEELAAASNLSRSQFAARFTTLVGMAPLEYLTQWRMRLAREALRDRTANTVQIATQLGYGSEAAFGAAFKRVFGLSPKRLAQSDRSLEGVAF